MVRVNKDAIIFSGLVEESLPNSFFRIKLENGKKILAYPAGRLKINRIRILVGDRVDIQPDQYANLARIVSRNNKKS